MISPLCNDAIIFQGNQDWDMAEILMELYHFML